MIADAVIMVLCSIRLAVAPFLPVLGIVFFSTIPATSHPRRTSRAVRIDIIELVIHELGDVKKNLEAVCEPGCGSVVVKAAPSSANADVESLGTGMSLIHYNPQFMARVRDTYGASVVYAILAHEYGHHVDTLPYGSAWTRELRADAFAGCALARRGDALDPTLLWMRQEHFDETAQIAFTDSSSSNTVTLLAAKTHPPWIQRMTALRRGVELCRDTKHPVGLRQFFGNVPTADALCIDLSKPARRVDAFEGVGGLFSSVYSRSW